MIDLEAVHGGLLGDDRLHEHAQGGDVPLAVAEPVEQAADRVLGIDLERRIEGATGREHPELGVEHDEGLVDGVDDRLSQSLGVNDPMQLVDHAAGNQVRSGALACSSAVAPERNGASLRLSKENVPPAAHFVYIG